MIKIVITSIMLTSLLMSGCTYYQTAPGVYTSVPVATTSKFDQSWSAAMGAFSDQGVSITTSDPDAGVIQGFYYETAVIGNINRQADGSVRVEFNASNDSALMSRITSAYNRRMGR
ncbi:MAG: hypothetical protein KAI02_00300 [Gammaproteobacteria bacterium]|nr:hypothetical protein [Gammaproteobacteria bacterium]